MIIFDPLTLKDWKNRGVTDVSLSLLKAGCAWEKIQIEESKNPTMQEGEDTDGITFHFFSEERGFFQNSRITHVKNKWILTNENINTRCGCGSSFSRKTGNPMHDKIAQMKEKLRQKKEKTHT